MIMAEMEKNLPVSINVTNQTGGVAGSNGMVYLMNQPDDGYTLVGLSESNVTAAVQGGWDKKFDHWYPFIVGGSPDLISVPADSPYNTLEELVDAAKAAPGTIPAAASGAGSIHHLNLLAIQNGAGAEIGAMTVPSAFDIYDGLDQYLPLKQAIGFAVANSASDEVKAVLGAAFEKAIASDVVADWAAANNYDVGGQYGEAAQALFSKLESTFAYTLQELGATTVDPASLGIEKP